MKENTNCTKEKYNGHRIFEENAVALCQGSVIPDHIREAQARRNDKSSPVVISREARPRNLLRSINKSFKVFIITFGMFKMDEDVTS